MLLPQGKNIALPEFSAIGDMLAQVDWELPSSQEYKNDLVQPLFIAEGVPKSKSSSIALPPARPQADSPISVDQWAKVDKMVAWPRASFFTICSL